MRKRRIAYRLIGCCLLITIMATIVAAQVCSDANATPLAKKLYKNMHRLQSQYTLFGHQDALAYGVGWKNINGKSDIRDVVGDNPAVYGWDIAHIEMDSARNIDQVPFSSMREYIQLGYQRGAVMTISWHLRNPLSGGSAWDTTAGTVASILPGGSKHVLFKSWLDKVAVFMNGLTTPAGQKIPILFRPFHELTGNWFWWCANKCSADEFKRLWRFTVEYLRNEKQLHQLIYVYNTAHFYSEQEYLQRYPGDDVVDIVSFDMYQYGKKEQRQQFIDQMRGELTMLSAIAKQQRKMMAIGETGYEAIPDKEWWTGTLWPAIRNFPLSYVLVWRNHGYMPSIKGMHYYAPYAGQSSAKDFQRFYHNPVMVFEKKIQQLNVYK